MQEHAACVGSEGVLGRPRVAMEPSDATAEMRMSKLTALRKPTGKVPEIMAGDTFRW